MVIRVALESDAVFAEKICSEMESSAKARGTGIAKRSPLYLTEKMRKGQAFIALVNGDVAGFCYTESWSDGNYIANSGLIIFPEFRMLGLARDLKNFAFEESRKSKPKAKFFGLTTSLAVMNINSELGYRPVTYSELTNDDAFWSSCKSCVNYETLQAKDRKNCLCTAMLYDPAWEERRKEKERMRLQQGLSQSRLTLTEELEKPIRVQNL
ncbi:MAG: GNAT family N-acetyltransferase [Proteobacteria bacterium]|nr:MAG: GNAT family N-acetyltransferase [Pseudomonadota bacterium]